MAHRIYSTSFASVYPHYVAKPVKGLKRTVRADSADFDPGRAKEAAPAMNPARELITGSVCGVKVQEVEEPLMREIMTVLASLGDWRARGHPRQADRRAGEGQGDGEDFAGSG